MHKLADSGLLALVILFFTGIGWAILKASGLSLEANNEALRQPRDRAPIMELAIHHPGRSAICCEVVLPFFADEIPRNLFAALSFAAVAAAFIARLVAQKNI